MQLRSSEKGTAFNRALSNHGGSEGRDFLSERYGLISSVNALWPIEPVPVVMTVPSHNAFLDR